MTGLRPEGCGRLMAAGCVEGLRKKVLRIDGPSAQGFLSLTALRAEGCGLPLRAMSIIMPPFGGHVHLECHNHSYPRTHRLRWMASHWIRGSFLSPMNPVPLPPQGETRALRNWLSMSYGMTSILVIGSLRSPPPIRLRRTSPRESMLHDSQVALLPYESCSLATPVQGAE